MKKIRIISQDDSKNQYQIQVQNITDEYIKKIEDMSINKKK